MISAALIFVTIGYWFFRFNAQGIGNDLEEIEGECGSKFEGIGDVLCTIYSITHFFPLLLFDFTIFQPLKFITNKFPPLEQLVPNALFYDEDGCKTNEINEEAFNFHLRRIISTAAAYLLKVSIFAFSFLFIFDAAQTLAGGQNLLGFHLIPEAMLGSNVALGIGIAIAAIVAIFTVISLTSTTVDLVGHYEEAHEVNGEIKYSFDRSEVRFMDLIANFSEKISEGLVKAKNFVFGGCGSDQAVRIG
jgi:hypothetical protein